MIFYVTRKLQQLHDGVQYVNSVNRMKNAWCDGLNRKSVSKIELVTVFIIMD